MRQRWRSFHIDTLSDFATLVIDIALGTKAHREDIICTTCDLSQFSSSCLTHNLSSDWLLSLLRGNRAAEENPWF
jgi:hypothetical protein